MTSSVVQSNMEKHT